MTYEIIWTIEKIKEGFEKFYKIHGRYPTDYEINDFEFLPTPRQIQRRFGGLVNLRKTLELPISNYSIGKNRSRIAFSINKIGKRCEIKIYELLKEKFDEKFIHIERPISVYDTKNRYDFYVFAKPFDFAIDVLSTDGDIRSFIKIMNIKENKYKKLNTNNVKKLYFVYYGERVSKERINKWLTIKKNKLPINWVIMNVDEFKNELSSYESYKIE